MTEIKELNEYIKILKRDIAVIKYLLYQKASEELQEFDELEYYEEFMKYNKS
ncbi:hypothetical protein HYU23_01600 [Candidatus Woesearchaeota archaeon]|nr:hypothetical protein [Candidatus Woesearchaeota archaeon]